MTDKTDMAALRDKHELALKDLTERLRECNRLNFCMDELSAFAAFSSTVIDQLEAERQRANESGERFYKAVQYGAKLEAELAALRGAQEPDHYRYSCGSCGYETLAYTAKCPTCNYHKIEEEPLFTHQPKPVVNLNHIGRITAQISGQRYTYFNAEDIRHYFEEMKCEIIERKSPISDTVYEPQRANLKPVAVLPNPQEDRWLAWSGDHHFRAVAYFKAVKSALNSQGIKVEIEAAGIVVKDGE